jgi:hypothetical protein
MVDPFAAPRPAPVVDPFAARPLASLRQQPPVQGARAAFSGAPTWQEAPQVSPRNPFADINPF